MDRIYLWRFLTMQWFRLVILLDPSTWSLEDFLQGKLSHIRFCFRLKKTSIEIVTQARKKPTSLKKGQKNGLQVRNSAVLDLDIVPQLAQTQAPTKSLWPLLAGSTMLIL